MTLTPQSIAIRPAKSKKLKHCVITIILLFLSIQAWFLNQLLNEYNNNLKEDVEQYSTNKWIEVRFWNVTNPDEILLGDMPHLQMTFPLVYDIWELKTNVTVSPNGEFISYNVHQFYLYNEHKSVISPNEVLTTVNPLIFTVYNNYKNSILEDKYLWYELMKEIDLDPNLLFIKATAGDQLFATYAFHFMGINIMYGPLQNATEYSISLNSGIYQPQLNGQIKSYNHSSYTLCWNPAQAIYPGYYQYGPYGENFITTWDPIYSFIPHSLSRTIQLNYNKTTIYNGTIVWQYTFNINPQLLNATLYPPNAQFSQFGPSGIFNLTTCWDDIQIFASLPFFYGATDYVVNNSMLGIPQPKGTYQPYILIENKTGNVYFANISLQYNTLIHSYPIIGNKTRNKSLPSLQNVVDDMMVPMYQISEIEQLNTSVSQTQIEKIISTVSHKNVLIVSRSIAYVAIIASVVYQIWEI